MKSALLAAIFGVTGLVAMLAVRAEEKSSGYSNPSA
jgi:hypothetical protein